MQGRERSSQGASQKHQEHTRLCVTRRKPLGVNFIHHDHQGSHFQMGLNNCICDGSREGEEEECGAAKNICEALMCQPGWSYTPYEIEKGNPSFQSCSVCDKWVLFMKTSKLAIPHLPQPLWQQKKKKRKSPETDQWDPLAPSHAENPNRCQTECWSSTTERASAALRLYIPPCPHPTRSAGLPTIHTHRCLNALLSAGCFPKHTPSSPPPAKTRETLCGLSDTICSSSQLTVNRNNTKTTQRGTVLLKQHACVRVT